MSNTNNSKSSKILALLSLIVGLPLGFSSFLYLVMHVLDIVQRDRVYDPSPDSLGENLGLIILRFFLLYVGILLICTGLFVFKNKSQNLNSIEDKKTLVTKSVFLQTLISSKSLYYTNIVIAFLVSIIALLITFRQFIANDSALDIVYGVIFIIIMVYSFKGAFSLLKNRNDIPTSKVVIKNLLIMPFRPRSILLISSLILLFVGFLTTQGESVLHIGEFDGIVFLVIGGFLFTRVKYFCKVCGKKMSRVESSYTGRDYENFQVHSTDTKVWIEGDVSDNYDYLYWCPHCKSYERVISKRKTNHVRIGE